MTATTKITREALVAAFKAAQAAALAADPGEGLENDGGSCNFDTAVLKLPGMRESFVQECAKEAGITASAFTWMGGRRFFNVFVTTHGQANRRTKMAEAAYRSLKAAGLEAYMYMQAD